MQTDLALGHFAQLRGHPLGGKFLGRRGRIDPRPFAGLALSRPLGSVPVRRPVPNPLADMTTSLLAGYTANLMPFKQEV